MTIKMITNETDARTILSQSTERQVLWAAAYMILPQDGSPIRNHQIVEWVHSIVDPIHHLTRSQSKSYTEVLPSGRRTRVAINSTLQSFHNGASKGGVTGKNWIVRYGNGLRRYVDNGAEEARAYFDQNEWRLRIDALNFMADINKAIDAEIVPIDQSRMSQNQSPLRRSPRLRNR